MDLISEIRNQLDIIECMTFLTGSYYEKKTDITGTFLRYNGLSPEYNGLLENYTL